MMNDLNATIERQTVAYINFLKYVADASYPIAS